MRAQVRKIKVGGDGTDDIAKMFNDILSGDRVPLHITWPRYKVMCTTFGDIIALHERLLGCSLLQHPSLVAAKTSVGQYVNTLREFNTAYCSTDLSDFELAWDLIEPAQHQAFHDKYIAMKKSPVFRALFKALENIIDFKLDFMSQDTTRSNQSKLGFILRVAGDEWSPFPFTLDLMAVMNMDGVGKNTHTWLIKFFRDYYAAVDALWRKTQEPDMDVDKFTEVIRSSLDTLKKQPELSRCRSALSKIESSIGMFRENFGSYYRNFIDTQDSTSIMHEFIIDVTKTSETNASITREFQIIINYYKKLAAGRKNDPKINGLFDKLAKSFAEAEQDIDAGKLRAAARAETIAARSGASVSVSANTTTSHAPTAANAANAHLQSLSADELAAFIDGK